MEAAEAGMMSGASCGFCKKVFTSSEPCAEVLALFDPSYKSDLSTEEEKKSKKSSKGNARTSITKEAETEFDDFIDAQGHYIDSPKTIAVRQQIMRWFHEDPTSKIIVYVQFLGMIKVLSRMCQDQEWGYTTLHGKMSMDDRTETIQSLSTDSNVRILLSSLKCGGIGLNLTAASKVICIDPWVSIPALSFCILTDVPIVEHRSRTTGIRPSPENRAEKENLYAASRHQRHDRWADGANQEEKGYQH